MTHYHNLSFDANDPEFEFGGYTFAFRVFTPSNVYGLDPTRLAVHRTPDGLSLHAQGLTWAGGQEPCEGFFQATLTKESDVIEWVASAGHTQRIKSIGALVGGLPRGLVAPCQRGFTDPGDDELLFTYPHMHRNYGDSIHSPLLLIQPPTGGIVYALCLDDTVRPKRFYIRPLGDTYHAEFLVEQRATEWSTEFRAPPWHLGRCASPGEAFAAHQSHIEQAFELPSWETRDDLPGWARDIRLVLNLHGMHWTGYVFNTFGRMLEVLHWVAARIDPHDVLVYLPGWDGRYYWNYPQYDPSPRLGGSEGFARLVHEAQEMGFHLMPMFGLNAVNSRHPYFHRLRDAVAQWPDGDPFWGNWVDWDSDRTTEGWMAIMNVGAPSWRNYLLERICRVVEKFGVDAIFLDIALFWINDPRHDMYEGTSELVRALRCRCPELLIAGEGWYDALLGLIPVCQTTPPPLAPALVTDYARAIGHLSHTAPGRGSTGVHEAGFRGFDRKTMGLNAHQIPTIGIVDDTFRMQRDTLEAIIAKAQE